MKRWTIKNTADGREFVVADGREKLGDIQPEWGVGPEIVEDDISQEVERARARRLLDETDWYVIREMDSGEPMPAEVKAARQAAREKI